MSAFLKQLLEASPFPVFSSFLRRHSLAAFLSARKATFRRPSTSRIASSSCTIIASFLALALELQNGGRLLPKFSAEAAASVFLGLCHLVVSVTKKSKVKKVVQAGATTGSIALNKRMLKNFS
jgi:hypothetical protein